MRPLFSRAFAPLRDPARSGSESRNVHRTPPTAYYTHTSEYSGSPANCAVPDRMKCRTDVLTICHAES